MTPQKTISDLILFGKSNHRNVFRYGVTCFDRGWTTYSGFLLCYFFRENDSATVFAEGDKTFVYYDNPEDAVELEGDSIEDSFYGLMGYPIQRPELELGPWVDHADSSFRNPMIKKPRDLVQISVRFVESERAYYHMARTLHGQILYSGYSQNLEEAKEKADTWWEREIRNLT